MSQSGSESSETITAELRDGQLQIVEVSSYDRSEGDPDNERSRCPSQSKQTSRATSSKSDRARRLSRAWEQVVISRSELALVRVEIIEANESEDDENRTSEVHPEVPYAPRKLLFSSGCINTYGLLDDGSTVTIADTDITAKIGAKGSVDLIYIKAVTGMSINAKSARRITQSQSLDIKTRAMHLTGPGRIFESVAEETLHAGGGLEWQRSHAFESPEFHINQESTEANEIGASDSITCVFQSSDGEEQESQDAYMMVEGSEGPLLLLQPSSDKKTPEEKPQQKPKQIPPSELIERAKLLQKAKALTEVSRRGRKRTCGALPPPHELLASPNFKLFLYSCKFCSFKCNAIKELTEHRTKEHGSGSSKWRVNAGALRGGSTTMQCAKCPYRGSTYGQFMRHLRETHLSNSTGSSSSTPQHILVCGACGFESPSREAFHQHVNEEHPDEESRTQRENALHQVRSRQVVQAGSTHDRGQKREKAWFISVIRTTRSVMIRVIEGLGGREQTLGADMRAHGLTFSECRRDLQATVEALLRSRSRHAKLSLSTRQNMRTTSESRSLLAKLWTCEQQQGYPVALRVYELKYLHSRKDGLWLRGSNSELRNINVRYYRRRSSQKGVVGQQQTNRQCYG
ncbi:hypothetical protein EVAR_14740_1 [Eumeta japonica]|uniref:C2H2-type domain-containing protein n=1 Tax=Eumeta variegata TaxID=151549 RepID=A0A4C1TWF4_EUMVA|nr:hypothetical protein EVAR_14740_1 [Eumeta japonica]